MIERSVGTHDGTFHADEVSACALLVLFGLVDEDKIFRTRDPEQLSRCLYVCDVGGVYDPHLKRFDHHQLEYTGDLSSAGMVWNYLLNEDRIDFPLYDFINRAVIMGVDAHDNGRVLHQDGVCTFSHIIANWVPIAYEAVELDQDRAFFEALTFAKGHFQRLVGRYQYIQACKDQVALAMQSNGPCLFFDEPIPWLENFFDLGGEDHPASFVIMPAQGHWKLRGIPPTRHDKMGVRTPLPQDWAGLREADLAKASGIAGAIFCHKGRFISIWTTKEDALKALAKVLE